MIRPQDFFELLKENRVDFFTGVPDSLLKDFCAYVTDTVSPSNHIIAANEGASVGLAAGYYLATGKPAMVYLQNSGIGNTINPLLSLADPEVYSIPMLVLIGWRGEPGTKDEPQHKKQGRVMENLMKSMEIPTFVIDNSLDHARAEIAKATTLMREKSCPVALLVKSDVFESYKLKSAVKTNYEMKREQAIQLVVDKLLPQDVVVSTTGKTSRELFEYRKKKNQGHGTDFLTVGSMGHASQIALGIALQKPNTQVVCVDGDGAFLMHMGSAAINGQAQAPNFKHVIINNGAHDSVGGQPTLGFQVDFAGVLKACGYREVFRAETADEISKMVEKLRSVEGPAALEIRVNKGARDDLGRPTSTPIENKRQFMQYLAGAK